MLFVSVRVLLRDMRIGFGGAGGAKVGALGGEGESSGAARARVVMQCMLTLVAVGMAGWVLTRSHPDEGLVRMAHMGLGAVLGYWFR
jgi:hypothetical protein